MAYRDRRESLGSFLFSLKQAAQRAEWQHHLIVCSVGSKDSAKELLDNYLKRLLNVHVQLIVKDDRGMFNKCRALNTCLQEVKTPFVTMLDVDAVMSPEFLKYIEDYYASHPLTNKLCHRVRYYHGRRVDANFSRLRTNLHKQKIAKEWCYCEDQVKLFSEVAPSHKTTAFLDNNMLGNSHFTCPTERLMEIGGYNPEFVGWGWEDTELNRRYWHHYRQGAVVDNDTYVLMNRQAPYEGTWGPAVTEAKNIQVFRQCESENFPRIDIKKEDWTY